MTDNSLERIKEMLSKNAYDFAKKEYMEHHIHLIDWLATKFIEKYPDFKPDDFVSEAMQLSEKQVDKQAVVLKDFQLEMLNLVQKTLAPYQQTEVAA